MASQETIAQTIATLFAAIRAMDIETWLATFAPDAVNTDPADAAPQTGHGEIRTMLEGAAQTFDAIQITENGVFINGQSAAVKWTAHFVGKNGKSAHAEGVDVIEFNEAGQIQKLTAYWNPAAMLAQLQ